MYCVGLVKPTASVYVPSLLFQTHLAVPTSCWQVVQFADGCPAVSQLIVAVAAEAEPAVAMPPTRVPRVSRPAANPRVSHAAAPVRVRRTRPMLTMEVLPRSTQVGPAGGRATRGSRSPGSPSAGMTSTLWANRPNGCAGAATGQDAE